MIENKEKEEVPIKEEVQALIKEFQVKIVSHRKTIRQNFKNPLVDSNITILHKNIVKEIGNNFCKLEGKEFVIDDGNKNVIAFLLYYFNEDERALEIFPDTSLQKNILILGNPGTGKTMLMQIFSEYLKMTNNPHYFKNVSTTQMANHYKLHSNIDAYTYNEIGIKTFDGEPTNLCMNDLGIVSKQKFFGTDVDDLMNEFLFARYEIYQNKRKRTHLTTNLSDKEFEKIYDERLIDRFKLYNKIPLVGESFR